MNNQQEELTVNEVSIFNFNNNELEVLYGSRGEPLFHANTVCKILGFGNPRQALNTHVDTDDVQKLDTSTNRGVQQTNYVNESGLYALILGCTKPEAKTFKKWVTSEVLPSIRTKGSYNLTDNPPLTYLESLELLIKKEKERQLLLDTNQRLVTQKEQAKLENGKSKLGATVSQVNKRLGTDYKWQPLQRWCENERVLPEIIYPNGYTSISAKVYPYEAWLDVYELDLDLLFGD